MTDHLSPTTIWLTPVTFADGSIVVDLECNTCGWHKTTKSIVDSKNLSVLHIRSWHGTGTVESHDFRMEVRRTGVTETKNHT